MTHSPSLPEAEMPIPDDVMQAAYEAIANGPQYMLPDYGVNLEEVAMVIAKAILAERQRSQWQDMSTAPRDGTKFIGWYDGSVRLLAYGKASHVPLYGFILVDGDPEDADICHPLAWMPLPAAPVEV